VNTHRSKLSLRRFYRARWKRFRLTNQPKPRLCYKRGLRPKTFRGWCVFPPESSKRWGSDQVSVNSRSFRCPVGDARELAVVTVRPQIPGARQFHFTQSGENAPRAQFAVVRLSATWAGDGALVCGRLGELQQLTECRCAGLMQSGTAIPTASRSRSPVCFALGENTA
jgi:hypothetical protein